MGRVELGRRAYWTLMVVMALGCIILSIAVANLAWTWWGHECSCISTPNSPFGDDFCTDTCISFGPLSVNESWGTFVLGLTLIPLGASLAKWFATRADDSAGVSEST